MRSAFLVPLTLSALLFGQDEFNLEQLGILDRVSVAARGASETAGPALRALELVALGRPSEIDAGWSATIGIPEGKFNDPVFSNPSLRAHAMHKIGETGLAEGLDFLSKLTPETFRADTTQTLWRESQIALTIARLTRTTDTGQKNEILKRALNSPAGAWAEEQLCNAGVFSALPEIQRQKRLLSSGKRGEDEVAFCEARMRVASSHPDRVKALSSVFECYVSLAGSREGQQLLLWAITELRLNGTPDADAALRAFEAELDRVLKADPSAPNLSEILWRVQRARARMNH